MIIIEVNNAGFDVQVMQNYITHIEETMGADDPGGLALLHEYLGPHPRAWGT